MKRNTILKIINPLIALLFLNQIVTALLHDYIPKEMFEILHEGGGFILIIGVIIHIILNWNWIKNNFRINK